MLAFKTSQHSRRRLTCCAAGIEANSASPLALEKPRPWNLRRCPFIRLSPERHRLGRVSEFTSSEWPSCAPTTPPSESSCGTRLLRVSPASGNFLLRFAYLYQITIHRTAGTTETVNFSRRYARTKDQRVSARPPGLTDTPPRP